MSESRVKSIRALARGIEVLQLLQTSGASTLHDLHRVSGVPKASLLRILKTLKEQGVIWQRMVDDAYVPSYALTELASRIDREHELVEVASPVLAALSEEVKWPSVLAVPRLTHMEVIETNAPRAYFDNIALGPVGFQINMLRSATGRAYIAFCENAVREAILDTLRRSERKGDLLARDKAEIDRIIQETRAQGYALRHPGFGGHFDEERGVTDDGRNSIAAPIRLDNRVPGAINITWAERVYTRERAVELFADPVRRAAEEISRKLSRLA